MRGTNEDIPCGRRLDLETAIRMIEDFADQWRTFIPSLRAAFDFNNAKAVGLVTSLWWSQRN